MWAPGAACPAHKGLELDKSLSPWGRRGCGEGAFVKTGLFVNTRAEVLMENQSIFQVAAVCDKSGGSCWQSAISFSGSCLSCLEAWPRR